MKLMRTHQIRGTKHNVHAFCDEFGRNDGISDGSARDISTARFYIGDQTPTEEKYFEQLKSYPDLDSKVIRIWTKLTPKDWDSFPLFDLHLADDDRYMPSDQAERFFHKETCKHCGIPVYRQIADLECPLLRKGKHSSNLYGDSASDCWGRLVSAEIREFLEREAPNDVSFHPVKDLRTKRYSNDCFQLEVKTLLPPIPANWRKLNIEAECDTCGIKQVTFHSDNGPTDFCEVKMVFERDRLPDFRLAATQEYLGSIGKLTEAKRSLVITQEFWQKTKAAKIPLGILPICWYNPETDAVKK